jgi:hypothetical protein
MLPPEMRMDLVGARRDMAMDMQREERHGGSSREYIGFVVEGCRSEDELCLYTSAMEMSDAEAILLLYWSAVQSWRT